MPKSSSPVVLLKRVARLLRSRDARLDTLHEWLRQLRGAPSLPGGAIRSVLFLCHGNICRSPFAAALLAARRPDLRVASAGLAAGRDAPADATAQAVAQRFGVTLAEHRSRSVEPSDLRESDLVLVMQEHQAERARALAGDPLVALRVFALGDFLEAPPFGLRDPWGCPEADFVEVFTRIDAALLRVVSQLPKPAP